MHYAPQFATGEQLQAMAEWEADQDAAFESAIDAEYERIIGDPKEIGDVVWFDTNACELASLMTQQVIAAYLAPTGNPSLREARVMNAIRKNIDGIVRALEKEAEYRAKNPERD